ncbi:MAG: AI-2E family transporter [Bacteroidales bacterium]|jgi:AI-2 transport protein TqsA|nr:AI-2E family transporter [Bacteroidales bacterium]MDG2081217.1 AI-2E family transporter [Bacteroidales bacterium]
MSESNSKYTKMHPMFYVAAAVIVIAGIKIGAAIINPILMAIFFSIIIYHPINWLKKKGVNGTFAIIIVVFGLLIVLAGIGGTVTKSVIEFSHNLPSYKQELASIRDSAIESMNDFGLNISKDKINDKLGSGVAFTYASRLLTKIGSLLGQITLLILIAAFILGETNSYPIKLKAILKFPDMSLNNITVISRNIRYYLGIKTLTGIIGGTSVAVVLVVMNVQYAVVWGLLVWVMRYIPNIGSAIASIPIFLFVLIQNGIMGVVYFGIAFAVINFTLGQIIEPKFLARGMKLSTLAVFLSLVFWGWILGDIGMLLAVPITMGMKISLETRENSKWMAIMLGSEKGAKEALNDKKGG